MIEQQSGKEGCVSLPPPTPMKGIIMSVSPCVNAVKSRFIYTCMPECGTNPDINVTNKFSGVGLCLLLCSEESLIFITPI
jgi:hypothetical protein